VANPITERLSQTRVFLLLRYTLIVATAYLLLVEGGFGIPPLSTCLVIAAALASNVVVSLLPPRTVDSKLATAAIVLVDTIWITLALLTSGRFSADFFFLYFFLLLLAATGESLALIVVGALAVCTAYVYVLASNGTWSIWNSPSIIRIPFLFTAAAFYGHMIDRTRRAQRHATVAQAQVATRTELLATVSHEIRNPVNGVLGWTALLWETPLTPDQRDYVEGIHRAGQSLIAIVNDVLDISKIEAGKVKFEQVAFSPAEAVEEATILTAEAAQRKGLELVYHLDPALPALVAGDPLRLRQILGNLLGNAIKFTAEGEVVVRARVAERDGTSILLRIEVTDTGVGIPRDQQQRIFEAFEQADSSTARTYGGTGLGLTISKRLATAMGGTIGVESRIGRGSTFCFTARLSIVPVLASAPEARRGTAADADARALAAARVLVVDDNAAVREILDETLGAWGVGTTAVPDAAAALARLRTAAAEGAPYTVALVDAELPDGGARELVTAIGAQPALAGLPVVLLAPLGADGSASPAVAASLHKPVRPARLRECLRSLLVATPAGVATIARPLPQRSASAG
jgi:signal transduction histidine kinase/CheY-like chemotaxis protein